MAKLEIPAIRVGKAIFVLKGDSPMVIHRFSEKVRKEIEGKQQGKAKEGRTPKDPIEEFLQALYVIPGTESQVVVDNSNPDDIKATGSFGVPVIAFKAACVRAGTSVQAQMVQIRMAIQVGGSFDRNELLAIEADFARMRTDVVRIKNGTDIRYRPEFFPWKVELPISYNKSMISLEQVANLVRNAGFGVGVMEGRPVGKESTGVWGRWSVETIRDEGEVAI